MLTRRTRNFAIACIGAALAVSSLAGCTRYYRIIDPNSGTTYYGTNASTPSEAGFVEFTDSFTQKQVTLQSPSVTELSKEQFQAAKAGS